MKALVKKIYIAIIILILSASLSALLIAKAPSDNPTSQQIFIPVLTYHRVIPKATSIWDFTPQMLEEHFEFFKSQGYQPISAAQFIAYQKQPELFPKKPIVLTFDDGNKSHYTYVMPLLKKYGFQATFFVYPDAIKEDSEVYLTWVELKKLSDAGFDIESHTMSHPFLTRSQIPTGDDKPYLNWLNNELAVPKALLENKLNKKVTLLAYPFGWFDSMVESAAVKAGYQGIFTVNWGQNLTTENPLRIKRRVMENTMTMDEIKEYINAIPLELEVISPIDTSIITQLPVIQFKVKNPAIKSVTVTVRSRKETLTPDEQGIYTFDKLKGLKPGYCMVIIRGYDNEKHLFMGSWGFNYQVPKKVKEVTVTP